MIDNLPRLPPLSCLFRQGIPNFNIPAFAEAASYRQANAKGMTNA
jgi:hypothetical protein